jgi:hypothetical protein
MKTLFCRLTVLIGIGIPLAAKSDIQLNGPGQSGQTVTYLTATSVPFESQNNEANQVTLPVYKFVLRGLEAQISLPPDQKGTLNLTATVKYDGENNTKESISLKLNSNKNQGALAGKMILANPLEFKGLNGPVNIVVSWVGAGTAKLPAGYFNILGEYQPTPPKPTGLLSGLPALTPNMDPNATVVVTGTAHVSWE